MAQRFVPGEDLAPALDEARSCNRAGMTASLDHLGENVGTREDAERACASYIEALTVSRRKTLTRMYPSISRTLASTLGDQFCMGQLRMVTSRASELW